MKRVFRWCRAAFLLAVALALGAWLIGVVRTAMQPSVRLPDGSVLHVAQVEFAEDHNFSRGSEMLSNAGDFVSEHLPFYYDLPERMRFPFERLMSHPSSGFSSGGESLAVWFWHQPETSPALELKGAELLDDATGERLDFSEFRDRNDSELPGSISFSILPRRQRTLTIRILAGDQTHLLTIKSPFVGKKFPTWHPSPLPQSQQVAGIEVTMKGWRSFRDGTTANHLNFHPLLDIRVDGELRNDWFQYGVSMEDAIGNTGSRLPLSESAWKITATIVRSSSHPSVVGDRGEEYSVEFIVPPPSDPR